MVQTNFRASDFNGDTPKVVRSKRDRFAEPTPVSKPIPQLDKSDDDVPEGTVSEILTWVGDDKDKAQKALDVETAGDKPRKGLVSQLNSVINDDEK